MVASEVQKLADNMTSASKNIKTRLEQLSSTIHELNE